MTPAATLSYSVHSDDEEGGSRSDSGNARADGGDGEEVMSIEILLGPVLTALCGDNALGRSRAERDFTSAARALSLDDAETLASALSAQLSELDLNQVEWHEHSGRLTALTTVHAAAALPLSGSARAAACQAALRAVTAAEPRVRAAAVRVLAVRTVAAWDAVGPLVEVVVDRLRIDREDRLAEAGRVAGRELDERAARRKVSDVGVVHETEGWKGLDTALVALKSVVAGCGRETMRGKIKVDEVKNLEDVLDVLQPAREHPNRFVREAALRLIDALLIAASGCDGTAAGTAAGCGETPALTEEDGCSLPGDIANRAVESVRQGLQDNWSQVRYVASECARDMLSGLSSTERRVYYVPLLPRMCLNRHYVAEGVRSLSQHTWYHVIGSDGRKELESRLRDFVAFYANQAAADNHAVREAACQALAEAVTRLRREVVEPHVETVLAALVDCAKDQSWPVRDHACRAMADVVVAYADGASETGRLPELYDLLHAHLADNIPSVRANCADALVRAATAFPTEHKILGLTRIADAARALLARARSQQPYEYLVCDEEDHQRDRNPGWGAAAKLARDNDPALHTNQVQYSCGSLAPKLRRGGGCMDHGFSRPSQPWEEADGGARVWRALAAGSEQGALLAAQPAMLRAVANAADVTANTPFAHQAQFGEVLWAQIAGATRALPQGAWNKVPDASRIVVHAAEAARRAESTRVRIMAAAAMRALRAALGHKGYMAAASQKKPFQ